MDVTETANRDDEDDLERLGEVLQEPGQAAVPDGASANHDGNQDTASRATVPNSAAVSETMTDTPATTTQQLTPAPSRRTSIRVDEATGGSWPFGPVHVPPGRAPLPYPFTERVQGLPLPSTTPSLLCSSGLCWTSSEEHLRGWSYVVEGHAAFH